jgi:hypothetical protein
MKIDKLHVSRVFRFMAFVQLAIATMKAIIPQTDQAIYNILVGIFLLLAADWDWTVFFKFTNRRESGNQVANEKEKSYE